MRVSDPDYPAEHALFEYDVGVNCPNHFRLDFTIPTRGADTYSKRYRVELRDTHRTITLLVYKPPPESSPETIGQGWDVLNYFWYVLL